MKEIKNYEIDGIDYGCLCREFNNRAKFQEDEWSGYFTSVLNVLTEMEQQIISTSKKVSHNLKRGHGDLGFDHPTDIIWVMSIIFTMRTIAILESKARDKIRNNENREAHRLLINRYLKIIQNLSENRNEFAALFPYHED